MQGMHILPILLFVVSSCSSALEIDGNVVTINNANDFIELSNNVNSGGITYEGSTVVLGNDIDFAGYSDKFDPVGESETVFFHGSFDGQGHTVSNLVMNTSKQFVGLFGVINGTSFRNVVVDSSCSFVNAYNYISYFSSASSIVGYIYPTKGDPEFLVEDCVNMASVTFSGEFDPQSKTRSETITASAGGVIGYFVPDNSTLTIKNCVNYGEIKFTGCSEFTSLGGIIASSFMMDYISVLDCHIKNCVNYGRLVCTGVTTNMLSVGGFVGISLSGTIENCIDYVVSIINIETAAVGKMVGTSCNKMSIDNCFWTNESDTNKTCGFEFPSVPKVTNSYIVESNYTTMCVLNEWVGTKEEGEYHKWMMLHLNGGSIASATEETVVTLAGFPITDPTKEGHSFVCWCTDDVCSSGEYDTTSGYAVSLYAKWKINDYTITFDFGNGTLIEETLTFNATITYPDVSGLKKFRGWNTSIERMPAYNLVVGENPKSPSGNGLSSVVLILSGIIGCAILIAVVIFSILFFVLRKNKRHDKLSEALLDGLVNEYIDMDPRVMMRVGKGGDVEANILSKTMSCPSKYADLYPVNYNAPTITEALVKVWSDEYSAKRVMEKCRNVAKKAKKMDPSLGLTEDEIAAVVLYTFDFGPSDFDNNPYKLLNKGLIGHINENLENVKGLLFHVMSALRKLPRYEGKTFYRGTKTSINKKMYAAGAIVIWYGLTSVSTNMNTVKNFLISSGEVNQTYGTLFVIEDGWGYDIQPYSLFPDEEEVLLEPDRQFVVCSVIESDVTVVNLKMIDAPLLLPQVFGDGYM